MSHPIVRSREYLSQHRRTIIGRSLAAAVAGALPIPFLDEWLVSTIHRGMIRRIADARGVDMDEAAITAIADGPQPPPKWNDTIGGGLVYHLVARQWKKLVVAVLAARRAQAAAKTFEIATLFDHYCARNHVGMGLGDTSGHKLRALIDQARLETGGALSSDLFRRGLLAAAKSTARAPMELADMLTGGRVAKLLQGESEVEATTEVDEALESLLASEKNFLTRSAAAIEIQLATSQNPYLDNLIDTFDTLYADAKDKTHADGKDKT